MPRRATKKTKKRSTKRRHRGGYYSMSGSIAPGAALYTRQSEMGVRAIEDRGANGMIGQGRKRKHRKTRRRLRGGQKFGAVYASYPGPGARGIADYVAGTHKPAQYALGDFNNKANGPGDFSSFVKAV